MSEIDQRGGSGPGIWILQEKRIRIVFEKRGVFILLSKLFPLRTTEGKARCEVEKGGVGMWSSRLFRDTGQSSIHTARTCRLATLILNRSKHGNLCANINLTLNSSCMIWTNNATTHWLQSQFKEEWRSRNITAKLILFHKTVILQCYRDVSWYIIVYSNKPNDFPIYSPCDSIFPTFPGHL